MCKHETGKQCQHVQNVTVRCHASLIVFIYHTVLSSGRCSDGFFVSSSKEEDGEGVEVREDEAAE